MKTFAGIKTLPQIKAQCEAAGIEFDDRRYKKGDDHVAIRSPGVLVLFSAFNGKFFGNTPDGKKFSSCDPKLDGTPWFDQLLSFFYVEKVAA
jgi:hypothetical protein